jgi:hypothetical protein
MPEQGEKPVDSIEIEQPEKRIDVQPAKSILKSPKATDGVASFGGSMRRTISWQDVHGRGELTLVHYFEPRYIWKPTIL